MRSFLALVCASFLVCRANAQDAARCIITFTRVSPTTCDSINALALCVSNLESGDEFKVDAQSQLESAQLANKRCSIEVAPSFKVVDRQLRVVTQEDVKFQRFRRDEVGVFELKEMIEDNTEKIAANTKSISDTVASNVQTLEDKIDAAVESVTSIDTKVDTKLDAAAALAAADIEKLEKTIKDLKDDISTASNTEVEIAASWQFIANPILSTNNRNAVDVRVVGKNFQQYDYSPDVAVFFECTFTLTSDEETTIVSAGQTVATETTVGPTYQAFAVICPSPVMVDKKRSYTLSIKWLGGEDAVAIPYNGAAKQDVLTFDMTWTAVRTVPNGHIIVDVDGLDVDVKHTCKFTQPDNDEIHKTADAAFVSDMKGKKLDCGTQPTGFAIDGTLSPVVFEIFVRGTKTKASYAGPAGNGPVVQLDTCRNLVKDGDETDQDCGGLCGGCGPEKACKVDNDCANGIPCNDKECGIPGKSAGTASESCKALLGQTGGQVSGIFWIDPDGKGDPFKVYCDQKTAGGGWIVLQHLHDRRPSNPCGMNTEYRQVWSKWENDGIGSVDSYEGLNQAQWTPKVHTVAMLLFNADMRRLCHHNPNHGVNVCPIRSFQDESSDTPTTRA